MSNLFVVDEHFTLSLLFNMQQLHSIFQRMNGIVEQVSSILKGFWIKKLESNSYSIKLLGEQFPGI